MKSGICLLTLLLVAGLAIAVDEHFTAGVIPIGWHVTESGLIKGMTSDDNAPAILIGFQTRDASTSAQQAMALYIKGLSKIYGKIKDMGPCSIAGGGTEGYETTDLTGTVHRFYIITSVAGKTWTVEVRAKTISIAGIEAELGNILANLKLK
jgi:hypothetical protein